MAKKITKEVNQVADSRIEGSRFQCSTCAHYINYRCRRHLPKGQEEWPTTYSTSWCRDHKMGKVTRANLKVEVKK